MTYRGYAALVEYDQRDRIYLADCRATGRKSHKSQHELRDLSVKTCQ